MKYFTEPSGLFVIKIPVEWQYKNLLHEYKEESPFSFGLYDNPEETGGFQISCYPASENSTDKHIQPADKDDLSFIKKRMDDDEFNIHLWFCSVEDHIFMAKYIYSKEYESSDLILDELKKVEKSLKKLVYISEKDRGLVLALDRYEKFQSAIAASFDLKKRAMNSGSLIEFIIIVANQIDAYLRLTIVMRLQLDEMSNSFDMKYFYQGEDDKAIMERAIYKEAKRLSILSNETFNELESLYKLRNKIVHRYIISEIKTKDLSDIAISYEDMSEKIRLIMKDLEDIQRTKNIGIYRESRSPNEEIDKDELKFFFAQVNDKHLINDFKRDV
jgi:hypothetical protein